MGSRDAGRLDAPGALLLDDDSLCGGRDQRTAPDRQGCGVDDSHEGNDEEEKHRDTEEDELHRLGCVGLPEEAEQMGRHVGEEAGGDGIINVEFTSDYSKLNSVVLLNLLPIWPGCNTVSVSGNIVKLMAP